MANRQDWKDRKRDPNPRNDPPAEQKAKRTKAQDQPQAQKAKQAKAPPKPKGQRKQEPVEDRKVVGEQRDPKRKTDLNPLLRVTDTQSGTIHDEAARLKLRQADDTSPREVVTVEGNKIEVVARPEVLHPVALLPHQRDTVIKDGLRDSSDPDLVAKADARVDTEPPDWRDHAAEVEATSPDGKKDTRQPTEPKKKKA